MQKLAIKPSVISISRRTDIPAYYSDWLIGKMKAGYTYYMNPYSQNPVFASLKPEHVKAIVFWTRNPKPLLKHLDFIDNLYEKRHYMNFTINGQPKEIEMRNPDIDFAISSAEFLARRYGTHYVQWRFDPIVISSITPQDAVIAKFDEISSKLEGMVERCIISFVDLYFKTVQYLKSTYRSKGIEFFMPDQNQQIEITKEIKKIADSKHIQIFTCAEDYVYKNIEGIGKAKCVDPELIAKVTGKTPENVKYIPTRLQCGCMDNRDIGYYDSCPHGCIYCYANRSPEYALEKALYFKDNGFPFDSMVYEESNIEQTSLF